MEINVADGELPRHGTLVVFVSHNGMLGKAAAELDELGSGLIRRALRQAAGDAKHGHILQLSCPSALEHDHLLIVTVGRAEGVEAADLAEIGAKLVRHLRQLKIRQATVASLDGLDLGVASEEAMGRLVLGMRLRAYRFSRYHTKPRDEETELDRVRLLDGRAGRAVKEAEGLAAAVTKARNLVSEPANVLTPRAFAEACRELASFGVEVEILEKTDLERLGFRTLLAVAQGSAEPPYVAVLRWAGAEGPPTALIGKGVCFDTGGISIKSAGGMEEMKHDMAGAAAVYGAMQAIATRKARAHVVGMLGLVENMPSGTATRPGDVVRSLAGKTIEIINTDAEGRLVLADLLWYTQERFRPRAMIDLATLTGAVIVALGHERAGLFASDDALAGDLIACAESTGELLWRLPLGKAYEKHIRSDIADMKNVGRGREAGSIAGAVFLEEFTNGVPWAHLDIAGTAWTSRDQPLVPKGATGFGVRLLDQYIAMLESRTA